MSSDLEIDVNEARAFLDALGDPPYTFQTIADSDKRKKHLTSKPPHYNGTLDEHVEMLSRMNQLGAGVYVMVNAGDGLGRLEKNVTAVRAVFVDLDGAPLFPVMESSPRPHLTVQTSPGRFHCYWLVRDFPKADFRCFQEAMAATFGADPSIKDLPRIMRLPGFYHQKKEPQLCFILENHRAPRYTPEDLLPLLTVPLVQPLVFKPTARPALPQPSASGREARRRQSYIQRMLEKEVEAVASEPQGTRNKRLFTAACNLASFLWAGEYSEADARALLEHAAAQSGMTEVEDGISETITSGLRKGQGNPREVPAARHDDRYTNTSRRQDSPARSEQPGDFEPEPPAPDEYRHIDDYDDGQPVSVAVASPEGTNNNALAIAPQSLGDDQKLKSSLTELWVSRLVFEHHGEDLRYVPGVGWRVWNGRAWRDDSDDLATRRRVQCAGDLVVQYFEGLPEATKCEDYVHKAFHSLKKECEKSRGIDAIVKHLRSHERVDATNIAWNADPYLLNLPNGVLDLRTAELRPHDRDLYLTQISGTSYDPDSSCPLWEKFLMDTFEGDEDLIRYIQWLCWYTLTGSTKHQFFCLLYGGGANGKTTFTNTLKYVLGKEYAWSIEPTMLLTQAQVQHSTNFADLFGRRFILAAETPPNGRMDESAVKRLTGEEEITARRLYQNNITFMPEGKLFICTNNKPRIADTSEGIWRRVRCIPFNRQIPKEERDSTLGEKLEAEAVGILAWMVAGRRHAPLDKAPELPKAISEASENYRDEEDLLGQFIKECCNTSENARTQSSRLYEAFKHWSGLRNLSNKAFTADLKRKGYETTKSMGLMFWQGVSLIEGASSPGEPEPDGYEPEERPFWDND